MDQFFKSALDTVRSDNAIIFIIVLFVLLFGIKFLVSKTKKLNQKQSFSFLNTLWIGVLFILMLLLIINIYPESSNKITESISENNATSINMEASKGTVDMNNSLNNNTNSDIKISI